MPTIIGLTGGIGAGKSTASAMLAALGLPVVDADQISRTLTGPDSTGSIAIARTFGDDFLTPEGAMDRAKMRELAFRDKSALKRLEAALHPLIQSAVTKAFEALSASPLILYDCPLLWRADFQHQAVTRILVIDAPDDVRLARILTRPGLTTETAQLMMKAQASRREILDIADDVVVNDTTPEHLQAKLTDLYNFWLSIAR